MTPARFRRLLPAILFAMLLVTPALAAEQSGVVLHVYDGDTLEVAGLGRVRLIGIDVPEWDDSERDRFLLRQGVPRHRLRRIARQAKTLVRRQSDGQPLRLVFDQPRYDRYGRTLAYAYLPDGRMLNRLLLEDGLAAVYRRFDFTQKALFLADEKRARRRHVGLWQP